MGKIKDFYKKHKSAILVTGLVVGTVVLTALITKKILDKQTIDLTGKKVISWIAMPDGGGCMGIDRVKEVLDANATNSSQYAIFREGPNPDAYECIILSEGFEYDKTFKKILEEAKL